MGLIKNQDLTNDLVKPVCSMCKHADGIYRYTLCLECYNEFMEDCTVVQECPVNGCPCHIVGFPTYQGDTVFVKVHDLITGDMYGVEYDRFLSTQFFRDVEISDIQDIRSLINPDFYDCASELFTDE